VASTPNKDPFQTGFPSTVTWLPEAFVTGLERKYSGNASGRNNGFMLWGNVNSRILVEG